MPIAVLLMLLCSSNYSYSQLMPVDTVKVDSLHHPELKPELTVTKPVSEYDVADLGRDIFYPKGKLKVNNKKPSGITVIPNIAANPTIGFQIGIKAVAGIKLGPDPATFMSVAATSISITTKGIIYFYINHNIYTPGNKWNLQGSLVTAKSVTPDFGLGIGEGSGKTEADLVLSNPTRKGYVLHSLYFNFREKVYKEIQKNLFVGAGVSFEIRKNIEDRLHNATALTPYNIYSDQHGFNRDHYSSNGLLLNVQYTTRDNQNRAYKGMYADAGFRLNQTWLGSSKNALQFLTDFRKYFSLSSNHTEHVLAFWNWGSYLVSGVLPYLEIAGTGKDAGFRSGRGYTVAYFKGTQYNYSEMEYRFPITNNKFLSGVGFFNMQTSNDAFGTKLFERWQPGGGAGLRVLFNKHTRTNLCLDYAFGKYGSKGFFLGLNEAF
ncbi:BamA/TamA family outer membrane protein [Ferruginibacter sp.]|uniref:BamA/TamA family outer membrane protein n=1 Tax=Ferruginibacter sp. TaxID=1940288 RepID=UPI002659AEF0|nr:BamA/TamA family outer membrane protein [Ferruginibacter sp.]